MFKLVLEKAEEPEIRFPTSTGSSKKQENSRKTSISALLKEFARTRNPRLTGEISITSDMQMTPPLWQKVKRS